MPKKLSAKFLKRSAAFIAAMTLLFGTLAPATIFAANLSARSLTLSTSAANTAATWTFTFSGASATVLKGIAFQICDAASGACNTPGSWANTGATFSTLTYNGTNQTGWAIDNAGAGGAQFLGIKNNSASNTSANPIVVTFNTVTNPNTTNATFYVRTNTFSGNTYTTGVDSGVVAASTSQQITFSANVDESLTFCTGTSGITTSSCAGATGSAVAFGTLSASAVRSGTSQIGVGTNAGVGYVITVNGTTPTCSACSGTPNIAKIASATASTTGTEQFGLNLRANATPSVGSDPAGAGSANPASGYNTVDSYQFNDADTVASKNSSDKFRLFTASYIANITTATAAGTYNSTLTYICTATF